MIRRKLKEIKKMAKGFSLAEEYEEIYIEGVSTDSRSIKKRTAIHSIDRRKLQWA